LAISTLSDIVRTRLQPPQAANTAAAPRAELDRARPSATTARATSAPASTAPIVDRVSFRGVPAEELTPAVKAAMGALIEEVASLRAERDRLLARARSAEDLADTDAVTGIRNRRAFMRDLQGLVSFADTAGVPVSVLFVDLDGFKQINDRHGHAAGDAALKAVARTLRAQVRDSDLVGRVGGDEFAVALARADAGQAVAKGQQLVRAIETAAMHVEGVRVRLGASCGTYECGPGDTAELALSRADEAMYAHKVRPKVASL
jgi:diguanylate cyclase (GGDEF)-like protein